jgi:hypothetical protein
MILSFARVLVVDERVHISLAAYNFVMKKKKGTLVLSQ